MRPTRRFAAITRAGERRAAARLGVILIISSFVPSGPTRAAVTLYEKDQTRLEMEFRLMAWGVQAGPELIPGGAGAPPDQEGEIYDFFVRRARILVRARLSSSLEIFFQAGQDNIGSKILKDDAGFRF